MEEKTLKKEDSASGLRVEARGITDSGRTGWNKENRNTPLFPKGSQCLPGPLCGTDLAWGHSQPALYFSVP